MNNLKGFLTSTFNTYIQDNPIVIRDLRTRMRGMGAFGLLIVYLLLIAIVMCIVFYATTDWGAATGISATSRIGSGMFTGLAWTQTIILMIVIPGVISAAVSKEYEKKTIEMVVLSRLNSFLYVFGKLISALLYCVVLVISTLPLAGICLMFGGISPEEIAVTYLLTIVFCFMMCSVGLYLSTVVGKTVGALLLFYVFNFFYLIQTGFVVVQIFSHGSLKIWSMLMIPANAAYSGMESAKICGVSIPLAVITVIVQILAGAVLLYASAARVKHWKTERAGILRVLLLVSFVVWALLGLGDSTFKVVLASSSGASSAAAPLAVLGHLLILASVVASGPLRRGPGQTMMSYLFTAKNLLKPDMSGAMTYVTVISLLTYMAASIAFYFNAGSGSLAPAYWSVIVEQLLLVLAAVWLAASTGVLFSALFRSRAVAVIMSIVVVLVAYMIYYGQYAFRYLRVSYYVGYSTPRPIVWPDHAGIIIMSCICLAISAGCLFFTDRALKQFGGVAE